MKRFVIFLCSMSSILGAQPVIQDGSNIPAVGFATTLSISSNGTNPGNAGANQVWDFSGESFTTIGSLEVVNPAGSVYSGNFPAANHCFTISAAGATMYTYQNYTSSKMEELSAFISAPGSGQDYSPNPVTRLVFPMSMGTTATDTWQKVGDNPNQVTITYDAYGTFVSPYNTYTGVVRVANDFGNNEIDYSWFTVNPLRLLAVHKHSDNSLILLDAVGVGVKESSISQLVEVFLNPAEEQIMIELKANAGTGLKFELFAITGAKVKEVQLEPGVTRIPAGELKSGLYMYQIWEGKKLGQAGKLSLH